MNKTPNKFCFADIGLFPVTKWAVGYCYKIWCRRQNPRDLAQAAISLPSSLPIKKGEMTLRNIEKN
jgi:hypothetical protein